MIRDQKILDFIKLIDTHKGIIYKVANFYCKDNDNRKDLIQEIIIQLWLSKNKYNDTYKFTTWIYRIALNVSISFYRKEITRSNYSQPVPEEVSIFSIEEECLENNDRLNNLHQFIKELKEIDRAIILLYLEERSHKEISEILGISVSNVSTKFLRIKNELKIKFSKIKE